MAYRHLNKVALAGLCGVHPNNFRPTDPDVIIGRYSGWKRTRVRAGALLDRQQPALVLMSVTDIAVTLNLSAAAVNRLRTSSLAGFPRAAACIEPSALARKLSKGRSGGWGGRVYGWRRADIEQFAAQTGREGDGHHGRRGRPEGSGDYASLPRCGRPRSSSIHGAGRPCRAVRRKIGSAWAPACSLHLTLDERHTLGL